MKITITRALAELKLLDSRINKEINASYFVDSYQERNDITLTIPLPKKEFNEKVKSMYASITSLIKRRQLIKSKVLISNSVTFVNISGKALLIVEAIEKKRSLEYDKALLLKMKKNFDSINNRNIQANLNIETQVTTMLTQNLGADKKADKTDWENIAEPFIAANEYKMIDPLKIQQKIEKLEKEIDDFTTEVDFVLSESNSKTEIEID